MKRHTPGTKSYFSVSGERMEYVLNEDTGKLESTGVILDRRVRFETMTLGSAEAFATDVYQRERIICEIHEVSR